MHRCDPRLRLVAAAGYSFVVALSHELDFITATTDTVYTMQNGKIRTDQEFSVHQHIHAHPVGSCPHEHCPPE